MTDLKQQVREAVESLRKAATNMYRDEKYIETDELVAAELDVIADTLEYAADTEPMYEVKWTMGGGNFNFDTEEKARHYVKDFSPDKEYTVRRAFVEPTPPKPEPESNLKVYTFWIFRKSDNKVFSISDTDKKNYKELMNFYEDHTNFKVFKTEVIEIPQDKLT